MKHFKKMRLHDKYRVERSKEPNEEGDHIVIHETKSLKGISYGRVFKGTFNECQKEKNKLEKQRLKEVYK